MAATGGPGIHLTVSACRSPGTSFRSWRAKRRHVVHNWSRPSPKTVPSITAFHCLSMAFHRLSLSFHCLSLAFHRLSLRLCCPCPELVLEGLFSFLQVRHCISHAFSLPFACVSTAFRLRFHCLSLAFPLPFVTKTAPFSLATPRPSPSWTLCLRATSKRSSLKCCNSRLRRPQNTSFSTRRFWRGDCFLSKKGAVFEQESPPFLAVS